MKNKTLFFLLIASGLLTFACNTATDPDTKTADPDGGSDDAGEVPIPPDTMRDGESDAPVGPDGAPLSGSLPTHDDGIKNLDETGVDCGGSSSKRCAVDFGCIKGSDCTSNACSYTGKCVEYKSCAVHMGGDTCGSGEVGPGAVHESCCMSLPVVGFSDSSYPGQVVYLDKYEITAGRMRAFIMAVTQKMGKPDVKGWITANTPTVWNTDWSVFLPSDYEGGTLTINRLLLGDPRHDGENNPGPGVIVPPATDQTVSMGLNHQFGGQVYADLHGNNCGTFAGAYGFPTFYYPPSVQIKNGEVPRTISQDVLDVKSMNCATNAMLAAFCAWDGGQLATEDVIDYVTDAPVRDITVAGCGSQYDNHRGLLGNSMSGTVQTGGRCAPVIQVNATFDAGDALPVPGSFLNGHVYHFPDLGATTSDKVWEIAAPGRVTADVVVFGGNTWMDLAGNLSESVLTSSGRFSLRGRGIGYGSSRSDLNVTLMPGETIVRIQRPEAKSALVGGRCMRFR